MNIFAFVGASDCGKTILIQKLIAEFKSRGHSVAVIKHCPHGFDIDPKAKDSSVLFKEGANPVAVVSPQEIIVFRKRPSLSSLKKIAAEYLEDVDIILVEGGQNDKSLKKIEVLRQGHSEGLKTNFDELIAVISDFKLDVAKPTFHPHQISQIADFLESKLTARKPLLSLVVDGESVFMNRFVRKIFKKTIMGMVSALDRVKKDPENIIITLSFDNKKNEKTKSKL